MADESVDEEVLTQEVVVDEPEDIDESDLAEMTVDDELLEEGDEEAVEEVEEEAEAEANEVEPATVSEEDEEEEEDVEEDDVEASLDVILKEKLVVPDEEADEEAPDQEDRVESPLNRVLPKQPDEFVCTSCFLVKHPSQLADGERMRCRDCV